MLLTSPSKIEDGLLHRTAQLPPKLFRTKLGVSPVVDRQQSPHDQGGYDLANDASRVPADEMIQLQPVFEPPEDNLNRPAVVVKPTDLCCIQPKQVRQIYLDPDRRLPLRGGHAV